MPPVSDGTAAWATGAPSISTSITASRAVPIDIRGGSLICWPRGEVLTEAGAAPETITAMLDLATLGEVRAAMPFLRDLRLEHYTRPGR